MFNYVIILILILFSALFSGLTLGLMGLNPSALKRKMSLGNKDAGKVYSVRKNGNLLLTTLLIGNVAVNTTLSIFLGSITTGFLAGLIATALIVIFGEITPQAVFSRYALRLGAKTVWLVKIFIFILYPISYPISWVLDKLLGEELPTIYSKGELLKIIEEHEDSLGSEIDADEERIVKGALTFSDKKVKNVMTHKSDMEILNYDRQIDRELLEELRKSSHSRFPVFRYKKENLVGILYLRQLLAENLTEKKVGEVMDKKVLFINEDRKLDFAFTAILKEYHHLLIVRNKNKRTVGVVTLEDILEEIIRGEIIDEADKLEMLNDIERKNS